MCSLRFVKQAIVELKLEVGLVTCEALSSYETTAVVLAGKIQDLCCV